MFLLEGAAAIFAVFARDTLAATILGLFSTSWLAVGLILITGTPGATTGTEGFYLVAFAAVVGTLALLSLAGKPLLALVLALSTARAVVDAIYQFSGTLAIERAAGYIAAAIAIVAWYAGTAMALEDLGPGSVLPTWRRGSSRTAIEGDLNEQLSLLGREPGVRRPSLISQRGIEAEPSDRFTQLGVQTCQRFNGQPLAFPSAR